MRRVLHPWLQRGHNMDRAAILLIAGLLTVLVIAIVRGVSSLPY